MGGWLSWRAVESLSKGIEGKKWGTSRERRLHAYASHHVMSLNSMSPDLSNGL